MSYCVIALCFFAKKFAIMRSCGLWLYMYDCHINRLCISASFSTDQLAADPSVGENARVSFLAERFSRWNHTACLRQLARRWVTSGSWTYTLETHSLILKQRERSTFGNALFPRECIHIVPTVNRVYFGCDLISMVPLLANTLDSIPNCMKFTGCSLNVL